mmetsp:Transcript_14652/g.32655  ORF Transcript_14652/g.32655 Transcript_14652/m.32655 type:complete len:120 (+) Transcript_14652:2-361(+)
MVKLSGEVMTSLAAFVTSLSRDNNDDNAATTATADDSSSVVLAQYAFESAYRSLHHLVKARAQFLASIWRGLCDVAVAVAAAIGSIRANPVRIPNNILSSDCNLLGRGEGEQRYHRRCV